MGYESYVENDRTWYGLPNDYLYNHKEAQDFTYHKDWNELMAVLKKLSAKKPTNAQSQMKLVLIRQAVKEFDIIKTHKRVVDYLEWIALHKA